MKITYIGIANDHSGYHLKIELIKFLKSQCRYNRVFNFGTDTKEAVDYPDYAHYVTNAIENKKIDFGILICSSGIGMSICANKNKYVRAALCNNIKFAKLAREHNNANALVLAAKYISFRQAKNILEIFLCSKFQFGRHLVRVKKISL